MIFSIFLMFFVIIADQLLKVWIVSHLALYETQAFIPAIVSLTHIRNTGGAWSILSERVNILVMVSLAAVIYFAYVWFKHRFAPWVQQLVYGLIIGGAVGNLIDRVRLGYVIDMLRADFMNFPIFNVADIAVSLGIGLLIVMVLTRGEEAML